MKEQMQIKYPNQNVSTDLSADIPGSNGADQAPGKYRPELADVLLAGVADEKQHTRLLETERILRDWAI